MINSLSIQFAPFVPVPLLIGLALVCALLAGLLIWLGHRGGWFRVAALALLVLALANPLVLREEREPLKNVVALIADESQSQKIGERAGTTRNAIEAIKARLSQFDFVEIRQGTVASDEATEGESRAFATVRDVLADVPPGRVGGAIVVTDGQVHDIPEDLSDLGFNAPVHGLITGQEQERDRRIEFVEAPRFGKVGESLFISYRVHDNAAGAGALLSVEAYVDGELVTTEQAVTGDGEDANLIELPIEKAGRNLIELSVEVAGDEVSTLNNKIVTRVNGIRENLRVLLVSGEPHAGERAWRNLLKSDAAVDLVHFTILRPPEKQDGTPINQLSLIAFPIRELFIEKIDEFDLIILDRYQRRNVLPVLYYDYISEYVRKGGALLVAAGPEYAGQLSISATPLAAALPALPSGTVINEAFHPRLTDLGERHPVTRGLEGGGAEPPAWSRWFRMVNVRSTEGHVVMSGARDNPLLVLDRYEEGRVALLLSDQGWLWSRGFEGGGPHVPLYRRVAHWLMGEPDLEEEQLVAEGDGQALHIRRQSLADTGGEVRVVSPSGETTTVPLQPTGPGEFAAKIETGEQGLYQVSEGDMSTLAYVGAAGSPETAELVSTVETLQPIAEASGGSVRRIAGNGQLSLPSIVPVRGSAPTSGRDWIGIKRGTQSRLVEVDRLALFSGLLGLAVLLLALGAMWVREGR